MGADRLACGGRSCDVEAIRIPIEQTTEQEKIVLRQAQHERTILGFLIPIPFALSLSRGERKEGWHLRRGIRIGD
jgi:hypothetical protein